MQELSGKVAAITGGANGIGLAMARRFASEGMRIALGDIEEPVLRAAEAELCDAGAEVLAMPLDVLDPAKVQSFADACVERFGGVDVFCNNAGVAGGGLAWEMPLSTWEWVIGVNLFGVVHGIRSFVPLLMQREEAHIVNTASVAGLVGAPFMGPYNASKHAVVGISETIFHELAMVAPQVKVSVLCPGWVDTGIGRSERNRPERFMDVLADPEGDEQLMSVVNDLLANGMRPEEIAEHVLDAVRNERFWILTHEGDEWTRAVEGRVESLVKRANPQMMTFG